MKSLRARIFLGAVLWMLALTAILNSLTAWFAVRFSSSSTFGHPVVHYRGPVTPDVDAMRWLHFTLLVAVGVIFLAGGLWLVRRAFAPLDELRVRLSGVRDGRDRNVAGTYPTEVQPLVNDLNALLDDRERAVTRAIATAGDLAHGLKTPLAVLLREAERAEDEEVAASIRQQVERMRRHVDYHLAHARATASAGTAPGVRCSVSESAEALARTMRQLHADRGLTIDVNVAAEESIRGRREDLDEMLGNLLDNACKWARSRVRVESSLVDGNVVIVVDDDGAGLDPSMRDAVLQRGVRADETAPGSGLGLAIVRDLADLYGGSITLLGSPLGGLRARLALPA